MPTTVRSGRTVYFSEYLAPNAHTSGGGAKLTCEALENTDQEQMVRHLVSEGDLLVRIRSVFARGKLSYSRRTTHLLY